MRHGGLSRRMQRGQMSALPSGKDCKHGMGIQYAYKDVKASDLKSLRELTKELLGGKTSYYRYHRGEKKLTPEQQDSVRRLFTKHGYSDVVFDFTAEEANLWNNQEA